MGNTSAKELAERKLITKHRFLQHQINNMDHIDPAIKHDILDIKKNRKYTNLVISGGCVKGYALVGVLEYLDSHYYLNNVRNIACSSFGSIFAMLYAIGYTVPEIKNIAEELDPYRLATTNKNLVSDIFHVATDYGANNGQYLIDTVADLIEKRTGNRNYTLEQLWKEKGINLVVAGADVSSGKTIYFWHGKHPRMPLRLLVRISCSLPGVYCPVILDGHYLADGGLFDYTPIHVFDGATPMQESSVLAPVNPETLAITFTETESAASTHKITNLASFNTALTDRLIDVCHGPKRYMRPSFWLRTIPIHVPSYPAHQFKLSRSDIHSLFVHGYESTKDFFESSIAI